MKIDIFCHSVSPKYVDIVERLTPLGVQLRRVIGVSPTLLDLERRFRIMDKYDDYVQVLTMVTSHAIMSGDTAAELAKIANDEMAELISKYPERFVAGVASLPANDVDAALVEADRAVNELNLRGVLIWASRDGIPVDAPQFMPFYEKMSRYDLPIWIHPMRGVTAPDYSSEMESKYRIFSTFGWPYDTTVAMARLVFSGVLEKYPNLKFITHHCGAMVPYFADRIVSHCDYFEIGCKESQGPKKHPIEYFRMFHNDTALNGGTSSLMCGYDFFGAEHLLFGTDMPFDIELGNLNINKTIEAVEQMAIPDLDKKKLFEDNARRLLHI
ncbi:hypothetical protein ES702_00297 [subsurface metagenome]